MAHCLVGAIHSVAGSWNPCSDNLRLASKAVTILSDFLGRSFLVEALGGFGLIGWNDDKERTQEEVIDLLKHAAKDLRNQGSPA
jgi:hypothetical protein